MWNIDFLSRIVSVENITTPLSDEAGAVSCYFTLIGRFGLCRPGSLFRIDAGINNPIVRRHLDALVA